MEGPGLTLELKSGRDILAVEFPQEEQEVFAPHQITQPRIPVPGRKGFTKSKCENQWRL